MVFAKYKLEVRMRRKAWRPLVLGVKVNGRLKTPKYVRDSIIYDTEGKKRN